MVVSEGRAFGVGGACVLSAQSASEPLNSPVPVRSRILMTTMWCHDQLNLGGFMYSQDQIVSQLTGSKTIAVVGLSPRPERPSHYVAKYLQEQGYRVIPVNPQLDNVLGEKCYPDLKSIPEPVDMVDVFRRSSLVGPIVDDAIEIGAKYVWMQDGVVDEEAAERAESAGLGVIMDN